MDEPYPQQKQMIAARASLFWREFLASLADHTIYQDRAYLVEPFGDSPQLADQLARLICSGIKTATCSSLWEWQAEGSPLPKAGTLTIILDGADKPVCIIETLEVEIVAYDQVSAEFAAAEGEGDRSLQSWRDAHWFFFTRSLAKIGRQPSLEMPLVCERFRLIYNPSQVQK